MTPLSWRFMMYSLALMGAIAIFATFDYLLTVPLSLRLSTANKLMNLRYGREGSKSDLMMVSENVVESFELSLRALPYSQRILQLPEKVCSEEFDPIAIAGIQMVPGRAERRSFLRDMFKAQSKGKVQPLFVLAIPASEFKSEAPWNEIATYNDLLIFDHAESHDFLSYKTEILIEWFNRHCASRVQFLLKIDDDVAVNWRHMQYLLGNAPSADYVYMGYVLRWIPTRSDPSYEGPGTAPSPISNGQYPPYTHGGTYVLGNATTRIFERMKKEQFQYWRFKNEDAMVGIILRAAGIRPRDMWAFIPNLTALRLWWCGRMPSKQTNILPCSCDFWAVVQCRYEDEICYKAWQRGTECTLGVNASKKLFLRRTLAYYGS